MRQTKRRTISRRQLGTLNVGFCVRFTERRYDACRRWYSYTSDVTRHVNRVHGDKDGVLDREKLVRDQMDQVHSDKPYYTSDSIFLTTCVDPDCALRGWEAIEFDTATRIWVNHEGDWGGETVDPMRLSRIRRDVHDQLRAMATGDPAYWKSSCPTCGKDRPTFPIQGINDKWIYVLRQSGQFLEPVQEIYSKTEASGEIHAVLKDGAFVPENSKPFQGFLEIPDLTEHIWHFFLSPVKLGRKALAVLCRFSDVEEICGRERREADPEKWDVPVMRQLQPWAATVQRRFSKKQLSTCGEIIPLVDPFAWAATAVEVDYYPMVQTQRLLALHPDEQAKLFIAGTLSQAMSSPGQERHSHPSAPAAPNGHEGDAGGVDHWNIAGDLCASPSSVGDVNVAKAWVDRYKALAGYLAKECDRSCCRVFFPALFSPGHRIVEISCQEHAGEPAYLAFGISHWLHLLCLASSSLAGRIFLRLVVSSTTMSERIPQKNVLRGESLGPGSAMLKHQMIGLPVQLFSFLAPAVQSDLADHLTIIGLSAWTLDDKQVDFAEQTIEWGIGQIDKYIESLGPRMLASKFGLLQDQTPLKDRMMVFAGKGSRGLKDLAFFIGVILRFQKWKEHKRFVPRNWEELESAKAGWEILHESLKFGLEQWGGSLERRIEKSNFELAGKVATAEELEALELSIGRAESVEAAIKVLEGPVGLVLNALDVIIEMRLTVQTAKAGDSGAMWGHLVIATGALIGVAGGLLSWAGVAAWGGPIGWVGALVMATGAFILAKYVKNDLQMFALHCFLGKEYGGKTYARVADQEKEEPEETGKPWMLDTSWSELRYKRNSRTEEAVDRFILQRAVLLRLLCEYNTNIVFDRDHYVGSCYIYPGLIPMGGIFQVEVQVKSSYGLEVYNADILPGEEKYAWTKNKPPEDSVIAFNSASQSYGKRWINVRIPLHAQNRVDIVFRSRLLLDPANQLTIPAADWYESHLMP